MVGCLEKYIYHFEFLHVLLLAVPHVLGNVRMLLHISCSFQIVKSSIFYFDRCVYKLSLIKSFGSVILNCEMFSLCFFQLNNGMDDPNSDLQHLKMVFEDLKREQTLLSALNEQRKTGKFCDMLVKVGDSEIFGHRSVLSISIPQIFEDANHNNKKVADNLVVELKGLDPHAVEKLIEFSYTARIEISVGEVTKLFLAARSLGLTEVENEARRFIEEKLLPFNWLSVRTFAQRNNCVQLLTATEMFLRENFGRICHGKEFMSLPRLQVELTGRLEKEGIEGEEICKTLVSWAKKQLQVKKSSMSFYNYEYVICYMVITESITNTMGWLNIPERKLGSLEFNILKLLWVLCPTDLFII